MDEIVSRIKLLPDHLGLSPSAFADKIGVQRSGISHILSGRNRPSLDLIMKIIAAFPEVDVYWILSGKGSMITDEKYPTAEIEVKDAKTNKPSKNADLTPAIEKIILFYTDGTFSEHAPNKKPPL
jgi:transcriptional regulator with XRE-family HTH domain